jgi:Planctomycete cytochrome C
VRQDRLYPGNRPRWIVAALATSLAGCPTDPPPACITVDTGCAPLYAPTFDKIYTNTLRDTCGSDRASCHSAAGMSGGMSFQDEPHAFAALRDGRVVPGDPACSKMIVRTDSPGAPYQMPPGDALVAAERCVLIQWVQAGALPGSGAAEGAP